MTDCNDFLSIKQSTLMPSKRKGKMLFYISKQIYFEHLRSDRTYLMVVIHKHDMNTNVIRGHTQKSCSKMLHIKTLTMHTILSHTQCLLAWIFFSCPFPPRNIYQNKNLMYSINFTN